MIVFGPVPSRRLGRSLGINNIPPKHCSYSCLYCQVGPTQATEMAPRTFYRPAQVFNEVSEQVARLRKQGEKIDYLTFVPDGEPTLDARLGETIELLRSLDIKIAVISNGSLIWQDQVRSMLTKADWVSLKVDTVDTDVWQLINRPHQGLELATLLAGMLKFAEDFAGTLVTETMLLEDINTGEEGIARLADFLLELAPTKAYIAIPTRPTADRTVRAPDEATINRIYQTVSSVISDVELLTGYEGNAFSSSGDFVADLLAITAVHPLRKDAVMELLAKTGTEWNVVQALLDAGKLREIIYRDACFYLRAFRS